MVIFDEMGIDNTDSQYHLKFSSFTPNLSPTGVVVTDPVTLNPANASISIFWWANQRFEYNKYKDIDAANGWASKTEFEDKFRDFIEQKVIPNPGNIINDWNSFQLEWATFSGLAAVSGFPNDPLGVNPSTTGGAPRDWMALMGIPVNPTPITTTNIGDWTPLLNSTSLIDTTSATTIKSSLITNFFDGLFAKFLEVYQKSTVVSDYTGKTDSAVLSDFFNRFYYFMVTGVPFGDGFGVNPTTIIGIPPSTGVWKDTQSYRRFFDAFVPPIPAVARDAQFADMLGNFVDHAIEKEGYFQPSHFVEQWIDYLRSPSPLPAFSPTQQLRREQAQILMKIFSLLTELIGVVQRVAIAQSGRLDFLTQWQKAYSDLMQQVPTITTSSWSNNDTRTIAQGLAQNKLDALRTERQIVTDEAKQFQTNVTATQDAASQQANLASSILQQLSGILSTVFR